MLIVCRWVRNSSAQTGREETKACYPSSTNVEKHSLGGAIQLCPTINAYVAWPGPLERIKLRDKSLNGLGPTTTSEVLWKSLASRWHARQTLGTRHVWRYRSHHKLKYAPRLYRSSTTIFDAKQRFWCVDGQLTCDSDRKTLLLETRSDAGAILQYSICGLRISFKQCKGLDFEFCAFEIKKPSASSNRPRSISSTYQVETEAQYQSRTYGPIHQNRATPESLE